MTVRELSREQFEELKQAYVCEIAERTSGTVYWSDLAEANNIPDEIIFEYYAGTEFTDDDFFCTTQRTFAFGDEAVITGPCEVNVSNMNFFDDLEYDCWELVEKYMTAFGFKSNSDIDFCVAKQVQDKIIELFEDTGVMFIFEEEE